MLVSNGLPVAEGDNRLRQGWFRPDAQKLRFWRKAKALHFRQTVWMSAGYGGVVREVSQRETGVRAKHSPERDVGLNI